MKNMNERIKIVVGESGMTKTAFGKAIGLTTASISQFISGKQNPSERTIKDICRVFHIRRGWLVDGTGEMYKNIEREKELNNFFGSLINDDVPFRTEIIYALSKMPPEWWELTGKMIQDAADAMEKSQESE